VLHRNVLGLGAEVGAADRNGNTASTSSFYEQHKMRLESDDRQHHASNYRPNDNLWVFGDLEEKLTLSTHSGEVFLVALL